MQGKHATEVTISDCSGIYTKGVRNEITPRVVIFGDECGCLVMDIFSLSTNEISYDMTLELIRIHDTIMALSVEYDSPMISAVHALIASHRGSTLINRATKRMYASFKQQIETAILSATCVTLLDLGEYMLRSSWLERMIEFMDSHLIDYTQFTPEEICVNITKTSYPVIASMRKTGAK